MNNLIKRLLYIASFFAVLFVAGCTDDIADEITELNTSRLFSPTDLDARVINQTSARLTWRAVKNASSYTVEFHKNGELNFEGSPERTLTDIVMDQLPLIVPGFEGETSYSVRVKAVGEAIAESKWISATFATDAEQIFFPVDPNEITFESVILRWPAGEMATEIVLEPGSIVRPVTADEVAAGVVEITDLLSETEYTAQLMNGEKVRGTIGFTTLVDLSHVVVVNPEDDLKAIIEAAEEGNVFALTPGHYIFPGNIYIDQTIEIVGALPIDRPVLYGVNFRMRNGSGLRLKDLILDGETAPDGNQTVVYDEVLDPGGIYGDLIVEDCIIKNYVKGNIYVNIAVLIESVTYTRNIFQDIETAGGDFIDFRNGMTRKFDFYHNTVYNSSLGRDIFRMDAGGSTNFPDEHSILSIWNNTFYNIVSVDNRRILYIRLASHEISVTNNIFTETLANYSNQSATTVVEMTGNNYHIAPNLYNSEFTVHDTGNYTTLNPGFTDPATGNFTVSNDDLILFRIGDPRWLP